MMKIRGINQQPVPKHLSIDWISDSIVIPKINIEYGGLLKEFGPAKVIHVVQHDYWCYGWLMDFDDDGVLIICNEGREIREDAKQWSIYAVDAEWHGKVEFLLGKLLGWKGDVREVKYSEGFHIAGEEGDA